MLIFPPSYALPSLPSTSFSLPPSLPLIPNLKSRRTGTLSRVPARLVYLLPSAVYFPSTGTTPSPFIVMFITSMKSLSPLSSCSRTCVMFDICHVVSFRHSSTSIGV